jgi:hypothetical protein
MPLLPYALPVAVLLVVCLALWFRKSRRQIPQSAPILIDGSNVMHWNNGTPDIHVVRRVVDALQHHGHTPGVVFDANVGYKISNRFLGDEAMANRLNLPVEQVMVSPKGVPADQFLLQAARDMDAAIITNDRFRDWAEAFPDVVKPERLVKGGFRQGAPYLKAS